MVVKFVIRESRFVIADFTAEMESALHMCVDQNPASLTSAFTIDCLACESLVIILFERSMCFAIECYKPDVSLCLGLGLASEQHA